MKEISIHELKHGQLFKFRKSQRKLRVFNKLVFIGDSAICSEQFKGKYLLIVKGCGQKVMDKQSKVLVPCE